MSSRRGDLCDIIQYNKHKMSFESSNENKETLNQKYDRWIGELDAYPGYIELTVESVHSVPGTSEEGVVEEGSSGTRGFVEHMQVQEFIEKLKQRDSTGIYVSWKTGR
jgi:hypothetical protein